MQYRIATTADYGAIASYLAKKKKFIPVDPAAIGGHWLIAEHEDIIRGTVWFFGEPPNAYVDYWTADGSVTATNLLTCLRMQLQHDGVERVHGVIHMASQAALRLAEGAFGVMAAGPYALIYKELTDGKPTNDADDGDTWGEPSGAIAEAAVGGSRG